MRGWFRHNPGADGHSSRGWLDVVRLYIASSAALHLVWEVLQLPLYTIWRTGTRGEIAFAVVHCTAGDVMIASLALLVALVLVAGPSWPAGDAAGVFLAAVALGAGYTVYSEWINTSVRKSWAYSELMPVLPGLGTGLAPLLQWLVVPVLAFAIAGAVRFRWARAIRGGA